LVHYIYTQTGAEITFRSRRKLIKKLWPGRRASAFVQVARCSGAQINCNSIRDAAINKAKHTHTHAHAHTHTNAHTHTLIHTHTHRKAHTHTHHTHTHTAHTHTHSHTHTHKLSPVGSQSTIKWPADHTTNSRHI